MLLIWVQINLVVPALTLQPLQSQSNEILVLRDQTLKAPRMEWKVNADFRVVLSESLYFVANFPTSPSIDKLKQKSSI